MTNDAISIIERYYTDKQIQHSLTQLAEYMVGRSK